MNEESLFLVIEEKSEERFGNPKSVENNENPMNEKTSLHAKVEPKVWLINSRCSNHIISDNENFIYFEKYDGGLAKFACEEVAPIFGKGTISIDGTHKNGDVYYVKGLMQYLFSVIEMCSKGYKLIFRWSRCEIKKGSSRRLVAKGIRTNGNVYYVNNNRGRNCILV